MDNDFESPEKLLNELELCESNHEIKDIQEEMNEDNNMSKQNVSIVIEDNEENEDYDNENDYDEEV